MLITLQVTEGPDVGRKATIRSGQVARIGRTEWSDFSFPGDSELADIHFALQSAGRNVRVRLLATDKPLRLNDQPITESDAVHGDRLTAGKTTFTIYCEGAATSETIVAGSLVGGAAAAAIKKTINVPEGPPAEELCELLELNDDVRKIAVGKRADRDFVKALADDGRFIAAVRVQAHLLPKRSCVWWGVVCVEELCLLALSPAEQSAWSAAREWVVEPEEEQRRIAEAVAGRTKYEGPASWLAMAAFWSGGSITPPTADIVKPDERLTGQALTNALMIAAVHPPANEAPNRYRRFLALGADVADEKIKLPKKS